MKRLERWHSKELLSNEKLTNKKSKEMSKSGHEFSLSSNDQDQPTLRMFDPRCSELVRQKIVKDFAHKRSFMDVFVVQSEEFMNSCAYARTQVTPRIENIKSLWAGIDADLSLTSKTGKNNQCQKLDDLSRNNSSIHTTKNEVFKNSRKLRKWLKEIKGHILPLCFRKKWSLKGIENQMKEIKKLQTEVKSEGPFVKAVCRDLTKYSANKIAKVLENCWHSLWLKLLEWEYYLEHLAWRSYPQPIIDKNQSTKEKLILWEDVKLEKQGVSLQNVNIEKISTNMNSRDASSKKRFGKFRSKSRIVPFSSTPVKKRSFFASKSNSCNSSNETFTKMATSESEQSINDTIIMAPTNKNVVSNGLVHQYLPNCATYYFQHVSEVSNDNESESGINNETKKNIQNKSFYPSKDLYNNYNRSSNGHSIGSIEICKAEEPPFYNSFVSTSSNSSLSMSANGSFNQLLDWENFEETQVNDFINGSLQMNNISTQKVTTNNYDFEQRKKNLPKDILRYNDPQTKFSSNSLDYQKLGRSRRKPQRTKVSRKSNREKISCLKNTNCQSDEKLDDSCEASGELSSEGEDGSLSFNLDNTTTTNNNDDQFLFKSKSLPVLSCQLQQRIDKAWPSYGFINDSSTLRSSKDIYNSQYIDDTTLMQETLVNTPWCRRLSYQSNNAINYEDNFLSQSPLTNKQSNIISKGDIPDESSTLGVAAFKSGVKSSSGDLSDFWDQETYLSEHNYYEEHIDEDKTLRFLNFGDDYRNYFDSMSEDDGMAGSQMSYKSDDCKYLHQNSRHSRVRQRKIMATKSDFEEVLEKAVDYDDESLSESEAFETAKMLAESRHQFNQVQARFTNLHVEKSLASMEEYLNLEKICNECISTITKVIKPIIEEGDSLLLHKAGRNLKKLVRHWESLQADVMKFLNLVRTYEVLQGNISKLKRNIEDVVGVHLKVEFGSQEKIIVNSTQDIAESVQKFQTSVNALMGFKSELFNINLAVHNFLADFTISSQAIFKHDQNEEEKEEKIEKQDDCVLSKDLKNEVVNLYSIWDDSYHRLKSGLAQTESTMDKLAQLETEVKIVMNEITSGVVNVRSSQTNKFVGGKNGTEDSGISESSTDSDRGFCFSGNSGQQQNRRRLVEKIRQTAFDLQNIISSESKIFKKISQNLENLNEFQNLSDDIIVNEINKDIKITNLQGFHPTLCNGLEVSSSTKQEQPNQPGISWFRGILRTPLSIKIGIGIGIGLLSWCLQPPWASCDSLFTHTSFIQLYYVNGPPPI